LLVNLLTKTVFFKLMLGAYFSALKMRRATFFILVVFCQPAWAQDKKAPSAKDYISLQAGIALPVGQFSNNYQLGFTTTALYHIHLPDKGTELQLQAGFQQFSPAGVSSFGTISALPFKVGWQQNVAKGFYMYGRIGTLVVKDEQTTYSARLSLDFGVVFDLKKLGLDVGFNGWKKENNTGWSNYVTVGLIFPFHKNE
jgi:hypothetical protein